MQQSNALRRQRHVRQHLWIIMLMVAAAFQSALSADAPGLPVGVATPLPKTITLWDEFSGRAEAVTRVEVKPKVSGFIEGVHFKDGALVKEGDLLFSIDKRPFAIAVEAAKADVTRQNAQVSLANAEVDRAEPLARTRVLSEQVFDQRKANLMIAKAQLLAAKAALDSAVLNLEWTEVRAPTTGRISDKKVDRGNLVDGGQSGATLLATIVSISPIHFVFDASEADLLRYSRLFLAGQRASSRNVANPVRLQLSDETSWSRTGTMDFVDNAMNERSGTIRGRAIFDNPDGLLTPGMFGRLQLFGGEREALLIPDKSIVSDQSRKIVYTIDADNTVKATPVTLGPIVDGLRAIFDGLKPDDKLVIDGIANPAVRPGAKVAPTDRVIETDKPAEAPN